MRIGPGLHITRRGGSGAPAPTLPGTIVKEAHWMAGAGRTMNGGNVQGLADQSGRGDAGRNLVQLTAGKQPAYVASNAAFNGQPTLTASAASGTHLFSGTWGAALVQPYRVYWCGQVTISGSTTWLASGSFDTSSLERVGGLTAATNVRMYGGATAETLTAQDLTAKHLSIAHWSGASSGYAKSARTLGALTGTAGTASPTAYGILAYRDGTLNMTGTWAETLIVAATTLTNAEHNAICDYFASKYAIAMAA